MSAVLRFRSSSRMVNHVSGGTLDTLGVQIICDKRLKPTELLPVSLQNFAKCTENLQEAVS
jgi:hypothetical protein